MSKNNGNGQQTETGENARLLAFWKRRDGKIPTPAEIKEHKERVQKGIAEWREFNPPEPPLSDAEKKRRLEQRKAEINNLYQQIGKDHLEARKLVFNSVHHAKRVGDLLLDVKYHLLDHGKYEDWVEENFNGGLSTARAYTRIAKLKNWKRIAPRLSELSDDDMTISAALSLLVDRGPEKKREQRWLKLCEQLGKRLQRRAAYWPENAVFCLAYDNEIMDRFEDAARKRHKELRSQKELKAASPSPNRHPV